MTKERLTISLERKMFQKLDQMCIKETRSRSNMIEVMIKFFDEFNKGLL